MIKRILGLVLVLIGSLGIVLSVFGIVCVWRGIGQATVAVDDALILLSDTLDNARRSLGTASATLDDAALAIGALYTTTIDIGMTLSNTRSTLDMVANLAEEDLAQSLESTIGALETMEQTAAPVDAALRTLSSLGLVTYDPDVALDRAIAAMRDDLEPVPDDLRQVGGGFRQTGTHMAGAREGFEEMGKHMLQIRDHAEGAHEIVGDQIEVVDRLEGQVHDLQQGLDRTVRLVAWGVTLLLFWIGFSQLTLVRWGINLHR